MQVILMHKSKRVLGSSEPFDCGKDEVLTCQTYMASRVMSFPSRRYAAWIPIGEQMVYCTVKTLGNATDS